jgi:hypothetical protein
MSDVDPEEENEGDEGQEGGESEEEKEEVKEEPKEEVKEEPTPPPLQRYVPRTNPVEQVSRINRDLDMLNSEINVISSEFVLISSAMNKTPSYYNIGKGYGSTQLSYTTPTNNTYTSPVRTSGPTSYWSNPNHITISPTKYAPAPQYYNIYDNYPSANYVPLPSAPPLNPIPSAYANNDFNVGSLIDNIDRVLNQPQSINQPQMMNTMSNTFDRASSFTPNFKAYSSPVRDTYVSPNRVHFEDRGHYHSPARQHHSPSNHQHLPPRHQHPPPIHQHSPPRHHYSQIQEEGFLPRREYDSQIQEERFLP